MISGFDTSSCNTILLPDLTDEGPVNGEVPQGSDSGSNRRNVGSVSSNNAPDMDSKSSGQNIPLGNSSQSGSSTGGRKSLGRGGLNTSRMPQKQREFFERIEQQHAVHHEEGLGEGIADDMMGGSGDVSWVYSSDEEGDATTMLTKTYTQVSAVEWAP